MTAFTDRLAGDRKRLMLFATIQGVERVFKERALALSSVTTVDGGLVESFESGWTAALEDATATTYLLGEDRTSTACIPKGGVDHGEARIDYKQLAEVGGGLKLKLQQPHGTTILEAIFRAQARRVAYLTSASVSKTAATFNVSTTVPLGSVGATVTFYMGSETIRARIASSTSFDTAERGMWGSRAQIHTGASTNGTAIYDVPSTMLGRRVSLYASFLKDDGATTTSGLTQLLATFTIDDNPKWTDDTITLDCGPCIDELLNRNCYVGLKECAGGVMYLATPTSTTWTIEVADALMFQESANAFTSVLITLKSGRKIVAELATADDVLNLITVRPSAMFLNRFALRGEERDEAATGGGITGYAVDTVRHIALIGGAGGGSLLNALLSLRGDLANGVNDVLPGLDRTAFNGPEWRMGAGINASDIDSTAFLTGGTPFWTYPLTEMVQVKDLVRDWCRLAERFVYSTSAGVMSTKPLSEERSTATFTINDAVRARGVAVETFVDESSIHPLLQLLASKSPLDGEFKYDETHIDQELVKRHEQRGERYVVEVAGLGVEAGEPPPGMPQAWRFPNAITPEVAGNMARRWQLAGGRGRLIAKIPCNLRALAVSPGAVVDIAVAGKDYNGGSISGRVGRVIGKRPQYDQGRCDLTLHVLDDLFVFAPSGLVTAVSTTSIANDTVTLSTTDPANDSVSPTDNFSVGMKIRLWDVSAGTSQELAVAAILNATQLKFTAGVTGAIEAGVDWLTWSTLGQNTNGTVTASGLDEDEVLFMMPDTGTAAAGATRRWR